MKGNYLKYLKETSAAYHHTRQLKKLAAPELIQFEAFYHKIIRNETYRKMVDSSYRIFKTNEALRNDKALQKKFDEIYFEIDWLGKEYRSFISKDYGLFTWKKMPRYDSSRPFFRLESELKIKNYRNVF